MADFCVIAIYLKRNLELSHKNTIFAILMFNNLKSKLMSSNRYRACKWLVEVLMKEHSLTQEEISNLWKKQKHLSGGEEMNTRFFHRCKQTLKEDFGIIIACKGKGYYPY